MGGKADPSEAVESALSLLKPRLVGTWHRISAKHLQAYLDEMCFRFDNRKNRFLFRDTLLKMLEAEPSHPLGQLKVVSRL